MAGAVITAALPDWRLLRSGHGSGPGLKLALALAILDLLADAFRNGEGLMPEEISHAVAVPPAGGGVGRGVRAGGMAQDERMGRRVASAPPALPLVPRQQKSAHQNARLKLVPPRGIEPRFED